MDTRRMGKRAAARGGFAVRLRGLLAGRRWIRSASAGVSRRRLSLTIVTVASLTIALSPGAEASTGGPEGPSPAAPAIPDDPARGLVYRGLVPAGPGSPCEGRGTFEVRASGRIVGCTHGPDPAPRGIDVREYRSTAEVQAAAGPGAPSAVPCVGDGVSGMRVEAIYAIPADRPDRYASMAPVIAGWAASNVDDIFDASAAETGGSRHVRFLTDASCQVVVTKVLLSASGDNSFGNTINELVAQGFTRTDRKYLVWMDAPGPYCGIAELYIDDRATLDNYNNGHPFVPGMVARIDTGCWGLSSTTPVEAHELMHNLGGVQDSAPHSTGQYPSPAGGHCTDDYDVMCYDDDGSGPVTMTFPCISSHERLFDCNHDDYFHTGPATGSNLATHWNTANSSFLDGSGGGEPPPGTDGIITGTVTNSAGSPVSKAGVSASGPELAKVKTGSTGTYTFTGLAPGTYVLKVTKRGCPKKTSTVTVGSGQSLTVNFQLAC